MFRQASFYLLLLVLGLSFVCIRNASPPHAVADSAPDSVFSAIRAQPHLRQITQAPHSTGTKENARVRQYIISACEGLGLQTEVQHTTGIYSFGRGLLAGQVYNIIARLKGMNSSKAVLIMAHYDSQVNAMGAGDDGAGVAAMLEVGRILKAGKPLQNDVLFLFTDAEEDGLLGAQAFVKESPLLQEVGLVLNFEGRGNSGISTMFEVNPENGWMVKEFIQSAKHPVANSLSFEIYKNLPNNTDFTPFKKAGVSGLNHAFVGGFVNYHSMTDRAENLDPGSLQHHGDNMLSLVKHFGNVDLTQTKGPDISYFNMMGIGMIHYPASWDKIFSVLVILLFTLVVILGIKRKQVTIKGSIAGLFIFIGLLVVLVFSSVYFLKGVKSVYPTYNNFYEGNSYNAHYYFIALTALAVAIFAFVYQWVLRRFSGLSLLVGITLTEILLMGVMYQKLPTATYILSIPLLFLLIGCFILLFRDLTHEKQPVRMGIIYFVFLLPAILLLVPTTYFMFIVFGLGQQAPGGVLMVGLILGLLLPLCAEFLKNHRYTLPLVSLFVCLLSLVLAHFQSAYTKKQPLQTNVWYNLESDTGKATWVSSLLKPDFWSKQFFTNPKIDMETERARLVNEAPTFPLPAPVITVRKDTIENNTRKLMLHCQTLRKATSFQLDMSGENLPVNLLINGKSVADGNYSYLNYVGLDSLGVDLELDLRPGIPLEIIITDKSIGLPVLNGYKSYPTNAIPGALYNSNTTQVAKQYRF